MQKLKPKQESFMFALITEPTVTKAYQKANISNSTAYKWLKDETFKQALMEFRRELMKQTTAKLQANSIGAIDTLVAIMEDENQPANARVQSSRTILEYAYKGLELEDIQERLDRLEQLQKGG